MQSMSGLLSSAWRDRYAIDPSVRDERREPLTRVKRCRSARWRPFLMQVTGAGAARRQDERVRRARAGKCRLPAPAVRGPAAMTGGRVMDHGIASIVWFGDLRRGDVARVGGKNASLGELIGNLSARGVSVPPGFASTADAYWRFIDANGLRQVIGSTLDAFAARKLALADAGAAIRRAILH
ncbi:PEP/pyruvate-binding domain-containing protein, partial [Burkholderia contaminans]|uniref:PEP/pyruvate-binding domain-containing protein n=1 Tax=Burkholderia contaminans TaxID=488447 RepID=UPI002D7E6B0A